MIKIEVVTSNSRVNKIEISGHAFADKYGKDIVCAGVSSIVITTINAIIRLNDNYAEIIKNNGIIIKVKENDVVCDTLIENMLELLQDAQTQYSKNIKIIYREVS